MTTCGNCKTHDVSVAHVRECYTNRYAGNVTSAQPVGAPSLAELARQGEDIEGVYFKAEADTYYKVVKGTNTGNWYAKSWNDVEWNYEGRAPLHFLTGLDKVTAEQAARFGRTTNRCVFCGRRLTDDREHRSVEVGYGPVCADREGLPWG